MPSYKSFCWVLGTTSFRTKNFNVRIERQLDLLDEFWSEAENQGEDWNSNNELQSRYYDFMQRKGFVEGDANNRPKDAREKTSGLVDIGLIDAGRRLTPAGRELLDISRGGDFSPDNDLQLPKDSFLYLKQLLKTSYSFDGCAVRPFLVLLRLLFEVEFLTLSEFTYLLPLCINEETTAAMPGKIAAVRSGALQTDDVILETLLSMENYREARELFLAGEVTEDLICTVGFNRKSRSYDRPYYPLYLALKNFFLGGGGRAALTQVYEATKKITIKTYWRNLFFDTPSAKALRSDPLAHLRETEFSHVQTEEELKSLFFEKMHLFKAKATLSDYLDLNRRYMKTTDTVLFEDDRVTLDILPKYFFQAAADQLYSIAFTRCGLLSEDCSMADISPALTMKPQAVIEAINGEFGTSVSTIGEARSLLDTQRYRRLQHLIDTKFTDSKLLQLLELFEQRKDDEITAMVTDNADIPTIFEYVLGIIWYKASERQGDILRYMKLSLEADLLPKTHAAGGEADIVYEYTATGAYPEHTLLLEATLADSTNQRRMEMEPVSRHLGQHILRTGNLNSYCVFATNDLNINVISDFRGRKTTPYYDTRDDSRFVESMKIIPLQTGDLKNMIRNKTTYASIYPLFEAAYQASLPAPTWYRQCVKEALEV